MKNMNLKSIVIGSTIISASLILFSCSKTKGCKDSTATNYNSSAQVSDPGSCTYATVKKPNEVTLKDANGKGIGTRTLNKDSVYILDGFVFVNSGQTLTIQAGTVIKGLPGTGASASALIIARGGKIMAEGTSTKPIIFTYYKDPLDGSTPLTKRGQWGGLILLGNARLNTVPITKSIEGIPTTEKRGAYGGTNDADNSGVLKWVSIRHGGTEIGAGNEINGLTLGAVGSGTVIDYVEMIANADDGVEFFGGTVNTKHMVAAYCRDDSFDYDEGFRGKGQFWLAIQSPDADRGGEHDGGTSPEDGKPYANPNIYNATFIGNGKSRAVTFRDNAGGHYTNSIFHNFGKGIDIEDLASGEDSRKRLENDELTLKGIRLSNITTNLIVYSVENDGKEIDRNISALSDITTTKVTISATNPIPTDATLTATAATDPFFDKATYKGAFAINGTNWAKGWTLAFK